MTEENDDDDQLKYTLTICCNGFVLLMICFAILRQFEKFDHIFKPNHLFSNKLQPPKGLFEMAKFLWTLSDEKILLYCGLDGLCFLRVLWDCFKCTLVMFPLGMILIGLYIEGSEEDPDQNGNLPRMTIGALPQGSGYFWGSFIMVYAMTLSMVYFLSNTYRDMAIVAEKTHLRSDQSSHTIMICNLPEEYQNEEDLYELMDNLFPDKVVRVVIARRLDENIKKYEIYQKMKRVTMIHAFLGRDISSRENKINDSQKTIIRMASERESLECCPVGFVSFKTIQAAIIASSSNAIFKADEAFEDVGMAPHKENVNWNNLHVTKTEQRAARFVYRAAYILLILFYTPFIVAIQGAANLDNIPGVDDWAKDHPNAAGFLQGFIPILVVRLFFQILPYVLHWLARLIRPYSRVDIERQTVKSYIDCLIGMGLLLSFISSIFLGSFSTIFQEAFDLNNLRDTLARNIPKFSTFNINYVIFATFLGLSAELSQVGIIFNDIFCWRNDHYEVYWFYYWPSAMYIFVLVAAYAVISPLIIVFGMFYFFLAYMIFAHQLIFVYKPCDLEGRVFTTIYGRIHAGVIIGQICLISQFALKENYVQAGLMIPAIFITLRNIRKHRSTFGKYFLNASLKAANEYDAEAIQDWIGKPGRSEYEHELLSEEAMRSGFEENSISMQDVSEDRQDAARGKEEDINTRLINSGSIQINTDAIQIRENRAESTTSLKDVNFS